jgi:hypothetical protein
MMMAWAPAVYLSGPLRRTDLSYPYPALAEEAESLTLCDGHAIGSRATRPVRITGRSVHDFRSNVGNLFPGDFTVFGHAIHDPRWRGQDHEPILEPYAPRLFRPDPARIRRGIDGGDKLLAVVRV